MFNPEEWTKLFMDIQGKSRAIYINEHTGLSKLRVTFTIEQQKALDCKGVDTGGPLLRNSGE
ncbi:hypothetical protein L1N85_10405 [Paenibacillus alkaliterrae]|uniref:hypothetical protein n=1 Tax=Paenibacillus alkaliterrae TaxID=320909 RepID=UPI001F3E5865|nr:hypothetical protein [Paenibacillus alkaliterrae]MCF2938847.1 hypothetical protein [Paenibacillus alkaliterrae]